MTNDTLTMVLFFLAYLTLGLAMLSYSMGHQGLKRKLVLLPIRSRRSKN